MKKLCIAITSLVLLFFIIYTPFKLSKILEYKDIDQKEQDITTQDNKINELETELNDKTTKIDELKNNEESNKEKLEVWKKEVKKMQENL